MVKQFKTISVKADYVLSPTNHKSIYFVTMQPNNTTYAQFCHTDFHLRHPGITFKFLTRDKNCDV